MATGRKRKSDEAQGDLFAGTEFFPVRRPAHERAARPVDLALKIKSALGQALKECPDSADIVAARMTELGTEITGDALYALTAPSKTDHQISLVRFATFIRATGATWLWDLAVEDDGLVVMEGREAHLAQLGLLEQTKQELEDQIHRLRSQLREQPVRVGSTRRPRRRG